MSLRRCLLLSGACVLVAVPMASGAPAMDVTVSGPKTLVTGSPGTYRTTVAPRPGLGPNEFVWPVATTTAWYEPGQDLWWATGKSFSATESGAAKVQLTPPALSIFASTPTTGMAHALSRPVVIGVGSTRSVAGSAPIPTPALAAVANDDSWYFRTSQVAQTTASRRIGSVVQPLEAVATVQYESGRYQVAAPSGGASGFETAQAEDYTCQEVETILGGAAGATGDPCIGMINVRAREWYPVQPGGGLQLAGAYVNHTLGGPLFVTLRTRGGAQVRALSAFDRAGGYGVHGISAAAADGEWRIAWCRSGPPVGSWRVIDSGPLVQIGEILPVYGDAGCRGPAAQWRWPADRTGLTPALCPASANENSRRFLTQPSAPRAGEWVLDTPWMSAPPGCTAAGYATRGSLVAAPDPNPSDGFAPLVRWRSAPGEAWVCRAGWTPTQVRAYYLNGVKANHPGRTLRTTTQTIGGVTRIAVVQAGSAGLRTVDAAGRRLGQAGANAAQFPPLRRCERPGKLAAASGRWVMRPAEADYRTAPDANHPGVVVGDVLDGRLPPGQYLIGGYVRGSGEWSYAVRGWQPKGSRWIWDADAVDVAPTMETRVLSSQPAR